MDYISGKGFDRFNSLGRDIDGIKAGLASDRLGTGSLALTLPATGNFRMNLNLTHYRARDMYNQKTYGFTCVGASGNLPGFWKFTSVQLNLTAGVHSDIPGLKTVSGSVMLLKIF